MTGYIKSDVVTQKKLQLFADVYSASLEINNKLVVTHKKGSGPATINKGYNPITLTIKTANRYDVRLISDIFKLYTNQI